VSRIDDAKCILVTRVSVYVSPSPYAHALYCTDPDVTWGNDRDAPSCALLGGFALAHGFRCYDNLAPNAKCQRVLVLAVCLVIIWNASFESESHEKRCVGQKRLGATGI